MRFSGSALETKLGDGAEVESIFSDGEIFPLRIILSKMDHYSLKTLNIAIKICTRIKGIKINT